MRNSGNHESYNERALSAHQRTFGVEIAQLGTFSLWLKIVYNWIYLEHVRNYFIFLTM